MGATREAVPRSAWWEGAATWDSAAVSFTLSASPVSETFSATGSAISAWTLSG